MSENPFILALGDRIQQLPASVRTHFAMGEGTRHYQGIMTQVWRRGGIQGALAALFLRLAGAANMLFPETGRNVPFSLSHRVTRHSDGTATMVWSRRFCFPTRIRRFDAVMKYSAERGCIVDWLGTKGRLEIELHPEVTEGTLEIRSGKQWLRLGRAKIPLPRWIAGTATIREWANDDETQSISVSLDNPLLGEFFGYEGSFGEATSAQDLPNVPELPIPRPALEVPVWRWIGLCTIAVGGTLLVAGSFLWLPMEDFARISAAVGVGAGAAWIGFGTSLVLTAPKVSAIRWADVCLKTMALGMAVLSLALGLNLAYRMGKLPVAPATWYYGVIVGASDLAMAAYFVRRAHQHGLSALRAVVLWIFVLNGICAGVVAFLMTH